MQTCPTCSTRLALADEHCPKCADEIRPLNDSSPDGRLLNEDMPEDGLASVREIVASIVQKQMSALCDPPAVSPDVSSQDPPHAHHQRSALTVAIQAGPVDPPQRISVRKVPRLPAVKQIAATPVTDAAYEKIKACVRQRQSRKARRILVAVCTVAALVLICAGAAIVSHSRTVHSAASDRASNSRGQNGADFSQLESGGLGS